MRRVNALAALGVLAAVRLASAQCPDGTPPPCGPRAPRPTATPPANSVAVLYLATRDTADLYLAEGFTEDIATGLGRLAPRVEVKAPSSVRRIQRTGGDLRAVGRALAVRYLVDGALRRTPTGYRVSIQLVNTQTELTAWGQTYDQSAAGLLDLPAAVAQAVAEAIGGALAPAERSSLAARATRDPNAWEHLLRGNYLLARRTQEDAQRAVAEYERALRLDSNYVDAYGALGTAYALAHNWAWHFPGLSPESLLVRAERSARHALALDTASASAWAALASTLEERNTLSMDGVVAAFRRAIALDPRRAEPFHQLGVVFLLQGDDSAGTASLRQALALDPERPITLTWLANAAMHARRYPEARRLADSALALAPDFTYALGRRAIARTLLGDTSGGVRDANDALRTARGDSLLALATLAWVEALTRDTAGARRHARAVVTAPGSVLDEATAWAAAAFVALGDHDAALDALERAPKNAFVRYYLGLEGFDPIREEPRFRRLIESLRG